MAVFLENNILHPENEQTCIRLIEVAKLLIEIWEDGNGQKDEKNALRLNNIVNVIQNPKNLIEQLKDDSKNVGIVDVFKVDIRKRLSEAGFTAVMYDILCFRQSEELVVGAQGLLEALLRNGNQIVQGALFLHARESDKTGKFFKGFRDTLVDGLEYIIKEREGDVGTEKTILEGHIGNCMDVFKLLKKSCSSHLEMQNALRSQKDFNRTSVDLVGYSADFLEGFVKSNNVLRIMGKSEIQLIQSCLEFLIASCQGPCPENQMHVAETPAVLVCQMIITNEDFSPELKGDEEHSQQHLQATAIQLIATCLEGRKDKIVHKLLSKTLDDHLLETSLNGLKFAATNTDKLTEISINTGMNVMSVWQSLTDVHIEMRASYQKQLRKFEEGQHHKQSLGQYLCYVEVDWQGEIEPVWFPRPSEANSLTEVTKKDFLARIDVSNRDTRLEGLMQERHRLCDEMEVLYKLEDYRAYQFLRQYNYPIHLLFFSATLLLNFLVILHSKSENEASGAISKETSSDILGYSTFLCVIILLCQVTLLVFYFLNSYQIAWRKIIREEEEEKKASAADVVKEKREYTFHYFVASVIIFVLFVCTLLVGINRQDVGNWAIFGVVVLVLLFVKTVRREIGLQLFALNLAYDVITTWSILRYLLYIALNFLGFFWHSSFFSFMLLDVVNINSSLYTVVQAITIPFRKMLWILALFCLSIVIFSSTGFLIFGNGYFCDDCDDDDDDGDANSYCENLWTCFFLFFKTGIITGGDLEDIVFSTPSSTHSKYYYNIAFLVLFFIAIGVLLFNMVTGIILDTFSSLREEESAKSEKLNSETFIAGLSRSYCQEKGVSFSKINHLDQNQWNYVYFILHLKNKKETYTGVEKYVSDMLKENDAGWFPHFTSFSMVQVNAVQDEDKSVEAKIESVASRMEKIDQKIERIEKALVERDMLVEK